MSEEIILLIDKIAQNARDASRNVSASTTKQKNDALKSIANELESNRKIS